MLKRSKAKRKKTTASRKKTKPRLSPRLIAGLFILGSFLFLSHGANGIVTSNACTPPCTTTYTVQPGETLWGVAFRHNTTPQAIVAANPGVIPPNLQTGPGYLPAGLVLNIPIPCSSDCIISYTVQPGETLWGVAFRHNTTPKAIIEANPGVIPPSLQSGPNYLPAGMVLKIPEPCSSKDYYPFSSSAKAIMGDWTQDVYWNLNNRQVPNFQTEWNYRNTWPVSCSNCQAVIVFESYASFSSVVSSYITTWRNQGISWVMYNNDPEVTPWNENTNPAYYSTRFYNLAHQYGLKVVQAPSLVYINNIGPKPWDPISDVFDYQGEYFEQHVGAWQYANAVCSVATSMHSVNQNAVIFIEVVADGTTKSVSAYRAAQNQCGSQFVGLYTSSFYWSNEMNFLTSVGLAHW